MKRLTVSVDVSNGSYRPRINSIAKWFCWFDYTLTPTNADQNVSVSLSKAADSNTAQWFPHVRAGIHRGLQEAEIIGGKRWLGFEISITKIITHDIDTTPEACVARASGFVHDELERHSVAVERSETDD